MNMEYADKLKEPR